VSHLSDVNDPFGDKDPRAFTSIGAATSLTHSLVQIRRMFSQRYPHFGLLRLQLLTWRHERFGLRRKPCFMGRRIPIHGPPRHRRRTVGRAPDEDRYVFCIQGMTVPSTVDSPEVVVVNFCRQSIGGVCLYGENLSVDRSIFSLHFRIIAPRAKFGRNV
jgi:hypothetical protein